MVFSKSNWILARGLSIADSAGWKCESTGTRYLPANWLQPRLLRPLRYPAMKDPRVRKAQLESKDRLAQKVSLDLKVQ